MNTAPTTSATELVNAIKSRLAELETLSDREERNALIDGRPANLDPLTEEMLELEARLEDAQERAAYEADAPKRDAEFRRLDAELFEKATASRTRIADLVFKLDAELAAGAKLADEIERVSLDPTFGYQLFRAGSKFKGSTLIAILRGARPRIGGLREAIRAWKDLAVQSAPMPTIRKVS
jgi:hypothetical protein